MKYNEINKYYIENILYAHNNNIALLFRDIWNKKCIYGNYFDYTLNIYRNKNRMILYNISFIILSIVAYEIWINWLEIIIKRNEVGVEPGSTGRNIIYASN